MTEWMLNNILLTGAGATFIIFIIMKIIPNEKLYSAGFAAGVGITALGRRIFGKTFWEMLEDFLLDIGGYMVRGFEDGVKSDNGDREVKK